MMKKKQLNVEKIFDFIKKPVITEKTTKLIEQKKYTFDVDPQLTKQQIKKIFEKYYNIRIKSIQTYRIEKRRTVQKKSHISQPKKRVIIDLDEKISLFQNSVQTDILKKKL